MEIFEFDRAERVVSTYGSVGLQVTRVAAGESVQLTCLTVEPGGVIGTHPAPVPQLFLVVAGEGWVAGQEGERVTVGAGQGVRWEVGEDHTSGTAVGFTALVVEGAALKLFEPEIPGV